MNILLLGATGAMGSYLTEILDSDEDMTSITITSRSNRKNGRKAQYILGNAKDNVFLEDILKGKTYDIIIDFMSYTTEEFSNRVNQLLQHTGHYVFLSSSRVYADTGSDRITESSPRLLDVTDDSNYLMTDEYALAKARQENILKKSSQTNWTCIRPYITYSNERLQLNIYEKEQWLYRALQGKPILFSSSMEDCYTTLSWGGDVARYIWKLSKIKPTGESFHIATDEPIKWGDVLKIYQRVLCEFRGYFSVYYTKAPFVPKSQYYQYKFDRCFNRVFDNTKLKKALGEDLSFYSAQEKLSECLSYFLEKNLSFRSINWRNEAKMDILSRSKQSIYSISGIKYKIRYLSARYTNLHK